MIYIIDEKTNLSIAEFREGPSSSYASGQRVVLFGDKSYKIKRVVINEGSPKDVTLIVENDGKKLLLD
jgi:hypothetical protein